MKINVMQQLKNWKGERILDGEKQPVLLREAIHSVLNIVGPAEKGLTAEKKNQLHQIGLKLYASKEPDFTLEQRALIKERAGLVATPLVYGRICEAVEDLTDKK